MVLSQVTGNHISGPKGPRGTRGNGDISEARFVLKKTALKFVHSAKNRISERFDIFSAILTTF